MLLIQRRLLERRSMHETLILPERIFSRCVLLAAASNTGMATPSRVETCLDADVFEACRRGDQEAFRILFETYKNRVYSFALRFFGDEARAADLTQDVFVKLYSRLDDFRGDARFETWLYRVVANACIDEQRKRRRFLPWLNDHHPSQVTGRNPQEDHVARKQLSGAVHIAISKLSPTLRVPILLRYMEGLSYEEISEIMNLSPGTVASRLNRAHTLLAKKLVRFRGMVTA
jgi:RNA polymerase sigma-70 factor (ECF subfamily)